MNKLKKLNYKLVHKATNYKPKPSKPKNIKEVVLATFNAQGVRFIVDSIGLRLNQKENWAVVLKALILVHSCYEEGSKEFEECIVTNANIFHLSRFKSFSPQNHPLTIFISKYARYLEEKCSALRTHGVQFEKKPELFDDMELPDILKILPKIQSQFNALCNCRITNIQRASSIIIRGYILLLKDSIILYGIISRVVVNLLTDFNKMNKSEATMFLGIYKLYFKETNAIIKIYDGARSISSNLPVIDKIDESIITNLEQYVDGLKGDANQNDEVEPVPVEDLPEELLGTNKSLLFTQTTQTTPRSQDDQNSDTDSSSGNDETQENDDFFNFLLGVPKNMPNNSFNPFAPVTNNQNGVNSNAPGSTNVAVQSNNKNVTNNPPNFFNTTNNNTTQDPFSLFSNTQTTVTTTITDNQPKFNPFEANTTTTTQSKTTNGDLNYFSKTNPPNNSNDAYFNPFSTTTNNVNVSVSTNPFGPSNTTTTITINKETTPVSKDPFASLSNNNPFL